MDIYRDYFTRESLTDSIVKAPYIPGQLAALFETRGLGATTLAIEALAENGPSSLTAIPRGAPLPAIGLDKRTVVTFPTQTYGAQGAVLADEVLNARAFGTTGAAEIVTARRDETVAKLRRSIDNLHESLRMACVLNPDNGFGSNPADFLGPLLVRKPLTEVDGAVLLGKGTHHRKNRRAIAGKDRVCRLHRHPSSQGRLGPPPTDGWFARRARTRT